jgi:transcriptional regulator with XRE-family HTH domain
MTSRTPATFARKLAAARTAAGLSQYELGRRSGVTKQALSLLELGKREPTWGTVQALACTLGLSCDVFRAGSAAKGEGAAPAGKGELQQLDGAVRPLVDDLARWGHMYRHTQPPGSLRKVATLIERAFAAALGREPRKLPRPRQRV